MRNLYRSRRISRFRCTPSSGTNRSGIPEIANNRFEKIPFPVNLKLSGEKEFVSIRKLLGKRNLSLYGEVAQTQIANPA
jgi:hypothetical protein